MDIPPELLHSPAVIRELDGACTREEPCWKKDVVDHREPEHGPGPGADLA